MKSQNERNPADPNSPENVAAREALAAKMSEIVKKYHVDLSAPKSDSVPEHESKVVITPTMRREAKNRALRDPKD